MGDGIEVDLRLRIARQDTEITALREDLATEKTRYRELWVIERALREEVEELGRFNTDLQCRWGSMENRAINAEAKVAELEKEGQKDYDGMRDMQSKYIAADHARIALEAQLRTAREDTLKGLAAYFRTFTFAAGEPDLFAEILEQPKTLDALARQEAEPEGGD